MFSTLLLLLPLSAKALDSIKLTNPLCPTGATSCVETAPEFAKLLITGILGLSGALALFMFVWGGLLWMTSGGNSQRVEKGRSTLVWATIGLLVIFGSYSLLSTLFDVFKNLGQ